MDDTSNYSKIREDAQRFYGGIHKVFSPAFNGDVYFAAEGFNHIIFKGSHSERDRSSQIIRFKLLPRAVKLLGLSTTHQEYEETLKEFRVKSYKKQILKTKIVRYWGVIAIIEARKIKVIIRKLGDEGQMHFWSVIPSWVTNKYRDTKFFSTMKGDPEED